MKNHSYLKIFLFPAVIVFHLFISSCNDDHDHNEGELITTLQYILLDTIHNDTVIYTFRDLDGDGGDEPEFPYIGVLKENTTYLGELRILNESANPSEDISVEVAQEALAHQVFFLPTSSVNLNIAYADYDSNGKPLGLKTVIQTGATSTGELRIILRHNPDKNASGVSSGNPANAGGEADIDVIFKNVVITP